MDFTAKSQDTNRVYKYTLSKYHSFREDKYTLKGKRYHPKLLMPHLHPSVSPAVKVEVFDEAPKLPLVFFEGGR